MVKADNDIITGKAYVLGDNIDTDLIIPAKYLTLIPGIPEEYRKLGSYALSGLPDEHPRFVAPEKEKSGFSVIIAGKNFGCGSSREHAPVCLGAAGTQAVVAESYARIFFRNAVATGELYPLESKQRLCDLFKTGDNIEISLKECLITNMTSGSTFELKPLGAAGPVVKAGGLFAYAHDEKMI